MSNARLIEALDASRQELAERADVERSLREIAARISAATRPAGGPPARSRRGGPPAPRRRGADRPDRPGPRACCAGPTRRARSEPSDEDWPEDPDETLDQGISGQAVVTGRAFWSGDYVNDTRFSHGPGADQYVERVRAPFGHGGTADRRGRPDRRVDRLQQPRRRSGARRTAALLEAIADQAAITIRTTRLIDELDRSREALGRRAEAEQALREIAARITILREPSEILQDVVAQAGRLVRADGVILDLLDPATGNLHWAYDDGLSGMFSAEERAQLWISVGVGATGTAVAEDRVIVADGDLASLFPPSPESTEFYERTGFQSMIAAPITGDSGPLGVIEVYAKERGGFSETDAGLVFALASQAAIAITNARLIDALARSRAELARRADSEQTLREIAARVSAILEPAEVLQQIVDETTRLLESDGARIDLYDPEIDALRWSYAAGDAMSVVPEWATTGGLKPGQAVAGTAFAEQRPARTDDYLTDERFIRDDLARAFVERCRDPLGHRGPAGRRRRAARDAVGRLPPAGRLRRRRRRGADRLRDAGLDRHPQRPPDRGAGPLARGHRASRRGGTGAARDRHPDHRHPPTGRPPPADRRRGAPPAACRRRGDRRVRRRRGRPRLRLRRGADR